MDEKDRKIIDEIFADTGSEDTITKNIVEATNQAYKSISFEKIKDFDSNPFKLYNEERLKELAESIKDDGLISPIFLWKKDEDYIILSGHNRFRALKQLGYETLYENMYKLASNISYDEARLIVADANLNQREKILPSERAKAYKIQQEVFKNKVIKRSDVFAKISEENAQNLSEIAEDRNLCHDVNFEKNRNIYRYLRLNFITLDLLEKVDKKEISVVIGVELSYLKEDEQKLVYQYFFEEGKSNLNMNICKKIREKSEKMSITIEVLKSIVESLEKPKTPRIFKLSFKEIREVSKRKLNTDKEAKEYILGCVRFYEENKMV